MKKSKILFFVLLSTMILCFTGCGNNQSSNKKQFNRFCRQSRKTMQMKQNLKIMLLMILQTVQMMLWTA